MDNDEKCVTKVIIGLVGLAVFMSLFFFDIKSIVLQIPGIGVFANNLDFFSKIISKYLSIILFGFGLWCIIFLKNNTSVTIPKVTIAGIDFYFKNVDSMVRVNLVNYLNTKRSLFKINCEQDNFDDVFESYYQIYKFLRLQMSYYENSSDKGNDTYRKMEEMVKDLNIFLTTFQSNYRRWYKFANAREYKPIDELQKMYPDYEKLVNGFVYINECMKKHCRDIGINVDKWK